MAAKITKKSNTTITGVLDIKNDGTMFVAVEDVPEPVDLSELFKDYAEKEVKIAITYGEDLD